MRARSPVRSPHRPPPGGRRPFAQTITSLSSGLTARRPSCSPFTSASPEPTRVSYDELGRAVGGAGGPSGAWNRPRCWPSTRYPTPTQGAAGRFALDDPYVEQVWAGVIGPSAVLALRRLPVLWREREPALVDLRELGQSLGLGPSLHRAGARPPARSSQVENVLCRRSAPSFRPRPFGRVAPALPSRMG
jgi:hypothetical protein